MKRRTMLVCVASLMASVFAAPAIAAFPEKPVTVICPWTAGGGTDVLLRALSKEAERFLGQTITVSNQTGGAGAIGHPDVGAIEGLARGGSAHGVGRDGSPAQHGDVRHAGTG